MDIEVMRLECLKMALGCGADTPQQIVVIAQTFMDFVDGRGRPKPTLVEKQA